MKKILFLVFAAVLFSTVAAYADRDDFLFFDLTLAGYCIGMTYDEASTVRPFHSIEDVEVIGSNNQYSVGFVENVTIEDINADMGVYFRDGRIHKVVARFNPSDMGNMAQYFQNSLGRGEDKSRVITIDSGVEIREEIFRWEFPAAEINLIGISSNTDFATASMIVKNLASTVEIIEDDQRLQDKAVTDIR